MKTRLVRINRKDMSRHQTLDIEDEGVEPLFYWYDETTGHIEIWPRDTAHKYDLTITTQEK